MNAPRPISPEDREFVLYDAGTDPARTAEVARRVVERHAWATRHLLRSTVSLLAVELTGQLPNEETPFQLWQAVRENPEAISEQVATTLDALSFETHGWVVLQDGQLEPVPLDEWRAMYAAWRARQ